MPGWLIIIIFLLAAVVPRLIGIVRRSQEKAQRERRQPAAIRVKLPWEFERAKEVTQQGTRGKTQEARQKSLESRVLSLQSSVDESAAVDEEAFEEETVARGQLSGRRDTAPRTRIEPPAPQKHEPVQIAGTPLSPQTIRQGIIMSEILRRPEF
jgi:hypothetical protein